MVGRSIGIEYNRGGEAVGNIVAVRSLLGIGVCLGMLAMAGCRQAVVQVDASPMQRPVKQVLEPPVRREFRAVWVATVSNIDWPSKPGLPVAQQKAEAVEILERAAELNMNAVIFQVRPQCDALYKSELEPWSYFLTGAQGVAPEPMYDPLEFWVEQAHARGMQLHAWFNPYRAGHPSMKGGFSEDSVIKRKPGLVRQLNDGYYWMDPAEPGTQAHSLAVMLDVARRYDVDGIHMDDYFYPYPSYLGGGEFPDESRWAVYREEGGKLNRSDWRRSQVDRFIENLYRQVKRERPHVQVGISPFGIWRPGNPEDIQGMDQYETLYADARLWLEQGWVDYLVPQLYWPIGKVQQSFPVLLAWWQQQNPLGRHLWPGLYTSRVGDGSASAFDVDEILGQILVSRGMLQRNAGAVHFSARVFMSERGRELNAALQSGPYRDRALPPVPTWLKLTAPGTPVVKARQEGNNLRLQWAAAAGGARVAYWVVHRGSGVQGRCTIHPVEQDELLIEGKRAGARGSGARVAVHSADRFGQLSAPVEFWLIDGKSAGR